MTLESLHFRTSRRSVTNIFLQAGILSELGKFLKSTLRELSVVIITDGNVSRLYETAITASLVHNGFAVNRFTIKPGERFKSLFTASKVYAYLAKINARRRTTLIAFGGGVVTDLGGFVASTYFRGIPYINVPTTLLAQTDSSIGGKVAVNAVSGKNLIGAFYHPTSVYIDPSLLASLPKREIRSGLAEVIKTAMISDERLFEYVEDNLTEILTLNTEALYPIIPWTIKLKVQLLTPDPYEVDLRRQLNFGHTFGHAIETATHYNRFRHGEAVAAGMILATFISVRRSLITPEIGKRVVNLIRKGCLPIKAKFDLCANEIWQSVQVIKMVRNGELNFVLPSEQIGKVVILNDVEKTELESAIQAVQSVLAYA